MTDNSVEFVSIRTAGTTVVTRSDCPGWCRRERRIAGAARRRAVSRSKRSALERRSRPRVCAKGSQELLCRLSLVAEEVDPILGEVELVLGEGDHAVWMLAVRPELKGVGRIPGEVPDDDRRNRHGRVWPPSAE